MPRTTTVFCPARRHSQEGGKSETSRQEEIWRRDGCSLCRAEDAKARELAEIEALFDPTTANGLSASRAA